jgi:shikimate dehydrogenase
MVKMNGEMELLSSWVPDCQLNQLITQQPHLRRGRPNNSTTQELNNPTTQQPMPNYGLIGYPLTHSFSGRYFAEKFERENLSDCHYDLFSLKTLDEFSDLLASHKGLRGLNVTIPYKEQIIPYLDSLSETAAHIGAVNTISIRDGKLTGDNTDAYGFEQSLTNWLQGTNLPEGALILGTGGAAKAVQFALQNLAIPYLLVSRKKGKGDCTYQDIDESLLHQYPLIINTTPLGTFPKIEEAPPFPYTFLQKENKLYDLVYNPGKTLFLKRGSDRGCETLNGLNMLILQAERSWEIWTTS